MKVAGAGHGEPVEPNSRSGDSVPPLTTIEIVEESGQLYGNTDYVPLTPAEKQKAYRERLKSDPDKYEKYLENERMRKRHG
jgi:hypothetical protein